MLRIEGQLVFTKPHLFGQFIRPLAGYGLPPPPGGIL